MQGYQSDNPKKRVAYSWISVRVEDVNDNEPQMNQDLYTVSVPEHHPDGLLVLQVGAADADQVTWTSYIGGKWYD